MAGVYTVGLLSRPSPLSCDSDFVRSEKRWRDIEKYGERQTGGGVQIKSRVFVRTISESITFLPEQEKPTLKQFRENGLMDGNVSPDS